jgi:HK97 family phage portal protein
MGWLSRKSRVMSIEQLAGSLAEWIGWGTASGKTVTETNSVDVTAVFCAVRVIAEGIAQMPVRVMADTMDGEVVRSVVARDHWAHRLLAVRPNGWQTSYEFREGMVFNAVLGVGAVAIMVWVGKEVRELLPVPAGAWSVEQQSDWTLKFRVDYADKTHGYFSQDQILYLRGPGLDGFQGLPAVRQAREAIGLSRVLEQQQARLAGNGGKPSGILSFKNPLSRETKDKLRQTWQERYGPSGTGGVAVVDGDAKFESITMTSVDAQYIETRRMQIEEIARALRVQPIMMMQADKAATYASAEQMFRMHLIHSLGPWMARFEQMCARDILRHAEGLRVDLDERALLRGDFKDQAEYYTKALGSGGQPGWMTPNEIRSEVGLNPVDEDWANQLPKGAMGAGSLADPSAPKEEILKDPSENAA